MLVWVRLDAVGGEEPLAAPIVPERPERRTLAAVASMAGRCEPEDVIANRLDPWHGSWFHPYSFVDLRVVEAPEEGVADADDRFVVDVAFKVAGRWGVPVRAEFRCPEPRTIVMRILEGEGAGSVVETHATPLGVDRNGVPRTAVIEATVATSPRPGFGVARRMAPVVRPLMRFAARRLGRTISPTLNAATLCGRRGGGRPDPVWPATARPGARRGTGRGRRCHPSIRSCPR